MFPVIVVPNVVAALCCHVSPNSVVLMLSFILLLFTAVGVVLSVCRLRLVLVYFLLPTIVVFFIAERCLFFPAGRECKYGWG